MSDDELASSGDAAAYLNLAEFLQRYPGRAAEVHAHLENGLPVLDESTRENWWPDDDEGTSCFFCDARPAVWAFRLNEERLVTDDGGFTLGGPLLTCSRCADLFRAGRYEALITVHAQSGERALQASGPWAGEIDKQFGGQLAAIAGAASIDERQRLIPHVDPPEIAARLAEGFEPLDEYTGVTDELGPLWPDEHAAGFPDTRRWAWEGETRWYVRSPWPNVSLARIFSFIWPYVDTTKPCISRYAQHVCLSCSAGARAEHWTRCESWNRRICNLGPRPVCGSSGRSASGSGTVRAASLVSDYKPPHQCCQPDDPQDDAQRRQEPDQKCNCDERSEDIRQEEGRATNEVHASGLPRNAKEVSPVRLARCSAEAAAADGGRVTRLREH